MRIGMVSTFPPIECGIGTYASYLVKELKQLHNEVYVVSQTGAEGDRVYPVSNSTDADLAEKVFEAMIKFTPDVVHIQHRIVVVAILVTCQLDDSLRQCVESELSVGAGRDG